MSRAYSVRGKFVWQFEISSYNNSIIKKGKNNCYKIRTKTGNIIHATSKHPFKLIDGWKNVEDLKIGDMIGTVKEYNTINSEFFNLDISKLLGYMVGDGFYQKNRIFG